MSSKDTRAHVTDSSGHNFTIVTSDHPMTVSASTRYGMSYTSKPKYDSLKTVAVNWPMMYVM